MKKTTPALKVNHRRPVDPVAAKAREADRIRFRQIDADNRARQATLSPTPQYGWEAARDAQRALENRVAELESMLNDAVDELADAKETIRKLRAKGRK